MTNIRFQHPGMAALFWLLLLLAGAFIYAALRRRFAFSKFMEAGLFVRLDFITSSRRRFWSAIFVLLAVASTVFALMRPVWNYRVEKAALRARNIVFVLDVSKSMLAEDVAPNRLERAKLAIRDCLDQLDGERVGLVAFAGAALVKCPLTLDYSFLRLALDDVTSETIGRGGTMIGDGIRKTVSDLFRDQTNSCRDIILLTDGEDHGSFPIEAAKNAGAHGVRILVIGLGDEKRGGRIPLPPEEPRIVPQGVGFVGYRRGSTDTDTAPAGDLTSESSNARKTRTFLKYHGQEVWSKLDVDTLRQIARASRGGKYFNVGTGTIDLGSVYHELKAAGDEIELEAAGTGQFEEKFQIFLALALAALSCQLTLFDRKRICLVGWIWLLGCLPMLQAESARDFVAKGNMAYRSGNYSLALNQYERALAKAPSAPQVPYDKGDALYRSGDYIQAAQYFQEAARQSKEPRFASRSQYNLGNCTMRQAEQERSGDLPKAIRLCRESLRHFQQSVALDSEFTNAEHNFEVSRGYLKMLVNELREKEKEKKRQQDRKPAEQRKNGDGQDPRPAPRSSLDQPQTSPHALPQKTGSGLRKPNPQSGPGIASAAQGVNRQPERSQVGQSIGQSIPAAPSFKYSFSSQSSFNIGQNFVMNGQPGTFNPSLAPATLPDRPEDILNDEKQNRANQRQFLNMKNPSVEKDW